MTLLSPFVLKLKQRFCAHVGDYDDMRKIGAEDSDKRIEWPCMKCGKVFYSNSGLEIISKNFVGVVKR